MSDIVSRLRKWATPIEGIHDALDGEMMLLSDAADEIERLRAALEQIVGLEVFGFGITVSTGGDVYCEGTTRFVREEDMVAVRRIARAALGNTEEKQ